MAAISAVMAPGQYTTTVTAEGTHTNSEGTYSKSIGHVDSNVQASTLRGRLRERLISRNLNVNNFEEKAMPFLKKQEGNGPIDQRATYRSRNLSTVFFDVPEDLC